MQLTLPKVFLKSPTVMISYDEQQQLGIAVWKGRLSSADLRDACLLCTHVVDKFGLTRWLADNRQMKAFSQEDQQWIMEHQVPQILASPLRRMATLVSEDQTQMAAIEQLVERSEHHHLLLRDFYLEEEALEWLLRDF